MRKVFILSAFLIVSGCANNGSWVEAHSGCSSSNASYLGMWACIQADAAERLKRNPNDDLALRYLAAGEALAEKVRARSLTDAQARVALAEELARGNSQYRARRAANRSAICTTSGNAVICQ